MKEKILLIIRELNFASLEDIKTILKIREKIIEENLKQLEEERSIFKIRKNENSLGIEGFILGINVKAEENLEVKRLLAESGIYPKEFSVINWNIFSSRVLNELIEKIKNLNDDIINLSEDPKKLEIRYFDLSILYHELYGYFYEKCDINFLVPAYNILRECRSYLEKLTY